MENILFSVESGGVFCDFTPMPGKCVSISSEKRHERMTRKARLFDTTLPNKFARRLAYEDLSDIEPETRGFAERLRMGSIRQEVEDLFCHSEPEFLNADGGNEEVEVVSTSDPCLCFAAQLLPGESCWQCGWRNGDSQGEVVPRSPSPLTLPASVAESSDFSFAPIAHKNADGSVVFVISDTEE